MDARRIGLDLTSDLRLAMSIRAGRLSSTPGRGNGVNAFCAPLFGQSGNQAQFRRSSSAGAHSSGEMRGELTSDSSNPWYRSEKAATEAWHEEEEETVGGLEKVIKFTKAGEDDDAPRTPAQRAALARLGISEEQLATAPHIADLLRSADGGMKTVLAAMRFAPDEVIAAFLKMYDSIPRNDRGKLSLKQLCWQQALMSATCWDRSC